MRASNPRIYTSSDQVRSERDETYTPRPLAALERINPAFYDPSYVHLPLTHNELARLRREADSKLAMPDGEKPPWDAPLPQERVFGFAGLEACRHIWRIRRGDVPASDHWTASTDQHRAWNDDVRNYNG